MRCDGDGSSFVGGGDEPEHELAAGVVERCEADFVDDDQIVAAHSFDGFADGVVGDGAVEVFDESGRALIDRPGELVCTRPFPSMPLGFWNDPDGAKYRSAYFERFPGAWHHGDWIARTPHDGFVIYGRSDATLNPRGVRIGTAELYRQVEQFPEVAE